MPHLVLGIDIGGSGIKGAPVDLETGALRADRWRIPTPQPATPEAVAQAVAELVQHFAWSGPVGCAFPAVVISGVTRSAANVDAAFIGLNTGQLLASATGCPLHLINDADAAGLAEARWGAGKGCSGRILLLTFGTGIGSALIDSGRLIANTELGHLQLGKHEIEPWASEQAREEQGLSWKRWAKRLNRYFALLDLLFSPDLYIFGGGVSKHFEHLEKYLKVATPVVAAQLHNDAGIAGAALSWQLFGS
jgi:polyphosphate glucokinase